MAPRFPAIALVAALLAAPTAVRAEAPPSAALLDKTQEKPRVVKVFSKDATEGIEGIKGLQATFFIAAEPQAVLGTLWDVSRFLEIFPDIKELKVLKREQDMLEVDFFVSAIIKKVRYTLRRRLDRDKGLIRWREIDGDVERIRGSWLVEKTAHAGVTKVTYSSFVKYGMFIPETLVRDAAIAKVEELSVRVRNACTKQPAPPPATSSP
jgi:ribosome-associated toxin RatA of RatAB toxin-antitoxin module